MSRQPAAQEVDEWAQSVEVFAKCFAPFARAIRAPRAIMFDIAPYLWPDDPWLRIEPPGNVRACYAFKHTVGLLLQPRSILEIGVRAGYAAAAFLAACPQASYYGVDADNGQHGGVPGAVGWARAMLARHFPGRSLRIDAPLDTRQQEPAGSGYDLAHVDGDHSFAGCVRDLELAERLGCQWILVDDIDYLPPVRQAVELFLGRTGHRHVFLPSFRGDCLIRTRAGDELRTPKGLDIAARGRAAYPGSPIVVRPAYPEGVA